jgi:hypothetical protein
MGKMLKGKRFCRGKNIIRKSQMINKIWNEDEIEKNTSGRTIQKSEGMIAVDNAMIGHLNRRFANLRSSSPRCMTD